jgi:hypothetical protein
MSNEEELEDTIVKKGEILYKELDERGRRESSASVWSHMFMHT